MGPSLAEDSFITPERELLEYAERLGRQGFGWGIMGKNSHVTDILFA